MTTTIYITQAGSCSPWSITWTETVVYVGRVCVVFGGVGKISRWELYP